MILRSIYGVPSETTKFGNIDVLKFAPNEYFFANASVNPDNAGFCTPPGNCLPAGVLNLTNCLQGKVKLIYIINIYKLIDCLKVFL